MTGSEARLERVRRVTSEALMEHFAAEHLSLEEFESRVDRVRAAATVEALREMLADLPGGAGERPEDPGPAER